MSRGYSKEMIDFLLSKIETIKENALRPVYLKAGSANYMGSIRSYCQTLGEWLCQNE